MLLHSIHKIDNAHFKSSSLLCFFPSLILQSFVSHFISYLWFKTCSEDKLIYFAQAVVWSSSSEDTSNSAVLFLLQPGKKVSICLVKMTKDVQGERHRYTKSETSGTRAVREDSTTHYSVDSKQLPSDFRSRHGCSSL